MKNYLKKSFQKVLEIKEYPQDVLLYRMLPKFFIEIISKYFRLEVEGLENIPKKGKAILLPNHSGYAGFDAILLSHEVFKSKNRIPRVLIHRLWFFSKKTSSTAEKMGFFEASIKNGLRLLEKNNIIMLFPEGEQGNFKPTSQKYSLQEFKRGFVRMALMTNAPIIPIIIIGAEETHINLRKLKFFKYIIGSVLPLPLNVVPLPAKWKIKALKPIHLPYNKNSISDNELIHEIAEETQELMQSELQKELANRKRVYLS